MVQEILLLSWWVLFVFALKFISAWAAAGILLVFPVKLIVNFWIERR